MRRQFLSGALVAGLTLASAGCVVTAVRGNHPAGAPCNGDIDCTPGSICWNAICVGSGVLRFSIAWTAIVDFDIHVRTPSGAEIYYANRSADGGMQDVDDCVGEVCSNPTGTHVENIFFATTALPGTYTFWAVNYDGAAAGPVTLDVFGGNGGTWTETLPATAGATTMMHMVTY